MPVAVRTSDPGGRNSMVSDTDSYESDDLSALNVSHTLKMGLYSINLGTRFGQRVHAAHMLILPLIPVFILLAQNGGIYTTLVNEAKEIQSVQNQVRYCLKGFVRNRNVALARLDHPFLSLMSA